MPERADHTVMDYFYNLVATSNPVGGFIPLSDTWGWSATLFLPQSALGTLNFQFTDFDNLSGIQIPPTPVAVDSNAASINVNSGVTTWRLGKAYDSTCNTAKWMRAFWVDNGSTAQSRLYLSITLKHQ